MNSLSVSFLSQGIFLGLAVAVPVGPISILCVNRSIQKGLTSGLTSGLGASTGDMIYALIAAMGLNYGVSQLMPHPMMIHLVGGVLLLVLGTNTILKTFKSSFQTNRSTGTETKSRQGLLRDYLTSLSLKMINPMTFIPFIAVVAGLYKAEGDLNIALSSLFILGVVISVLLWRTMLCFASTLLGGGFQGSQLRLLNRLSGATIIMFGLGSVLNILPNTL